MLREELLNKVLGVLDQAGYELARQFSPSCFDVLAKKGKILLIKVVSNIDSLYEDQANDLKRIAKILDGTPLLISLMCKGQCMKESTLYERFGVAAVSFDTFNESILDHRNPIVYAKRGGFYAHLNTEFLKKIREQHNLSSGDLAREAGISKTALQNYEKGQGAEIENILRLQDALGDLILDPIDILKFEQKPVEEPKEDTQLEKHVSGKLHEIGFETTTVTKASFRMIGRHKDDLLFTGMKSPLDKHAKDIHETTSTLGQHGMFVLEKTNQKSISGIPILEREELEGVITSRDLLKLLKELCEE